MKLKEVLPVLFVVKEDFVERMALTARAYGIYPQIKSFEVRPSVDVVTGIKMTLLNEFGYTDAVEIELVNKPTNLSKNCVGYRVAFDKRGDMVAFIETWVKYGDPEFGGDLVVHDFVYLK